MQWELIATWLGLLITIGSFVYHMGKQAQKINNQQDQIDELKEQVKEAQETPIKLATLETDIKYLVQEMTVIKNFLMQQPRSK
jgi:Tfp pilus assembly protein PilN